jgi:hypothetical protein
MKIMHDYFDMDCLTVASNSKGGAPLIKLKKVNKSSSAARLDTSP